MIPVPTAKVDMHCHSRASQVAKLGIQRSLGLPECATPPDEVYELAKRRGMDFVTITDHDTIEGCLELVDRPDAFISEELTARFRGEPQAVHVLCYGIAPEDHEFLQEHADDVEECAAYMRAHGIACALAHPFFDVAAPLSPRHRRRLARLFPIWETRNGARAPALNQPAAIYVETRGGTGIGGSDDHAGVDIGRTWTEVPPATTPEEFLRHVQEGHADACGGQGSAEKWAHSALALAVRALAPRHAGERSPESVNPASVLEMAERVVAHGLERGGSPGGELGPDDALALLRAWLGSLELGDDPWALIELMLQDGFGHADLARRARLLHERRLREAVEGVGAEPAGLDRYARLAPALFAACIPAVPYVPAATFLGREKAKLSDGEGEPGRVALVVDGAGAVHGVTHTVEQVRERGVPGWDVDVVGTDPRVDRRLAAVAEVEIPSYPGLAVGVPSVPELVGNLTEGGYDLIHIVSPGPAGIGAALTARIGGLPLCGSYHTELAAYAGLRTGDPRVEATARLVLSLFYRQCDVVLSPSPTADASLASLGVDADRVGRWVRGVDLDLFDPRRRSPDGLPGVVRVLYAGRLSIEKGVDLLADAFLRARERDPRLHLLLAGGGPEEGMLRERLGERVTFLGWLGREELARVYASADVFLFCSRTDTYGQVISEAQASGLPVVAVDQGGPRSLIRNRRTGWLCPADAGALADAVAQLAASPYLRASVAEHALREVRARTWDVALGELAAGYARALGAAGRKVTPAPASRAA